MAHPERRRWLQAAGSSSRLSSAPCGAPSTECTPCLCSVWGPTPPQRARPRGHRRHRHRLSTFRCLVRARAGPGHAGVRLQGGGKGPGSACRAGASLAAGGGGRPDMCCAAQQEPGAGRRLLLQCASARENDTGAGSAWGQVQAIPNLYACRMDLGRSVLAWCTKPAALSCASERGATARAPAASGHGERSAFGVDPGWRLFGSRSCAYHLDQSAQWSCISKQGAMMCEGMHVAGQYRYQSISGPHSTSRCKCCRAG